jgi:hypothetical protein
MADYFEKYGIGLSSEEDAKLMRECVKLIKDIKDHTAINFVEEELSQDKKRVLFDTIKENINGWWD